MKLIADLHTHTLASGHAYGTIRENAQAAAERGLHILGVTEHAPGISGTCDPIYFLNLRSVPETLYGVRVLHGSEINVLEGGKLSLPERHIAALDYAAAGIHIQCYKDQGAAANTKNVIGCMKQSKKLRFITHPDDSRTPLDYEELCRAARDYHVALEVNNASLIEPTFRVNSRANDERMLACCEKYRVPVVVNSDAHDPSAVGRVDLALGLLEAAGFDEQLVLNADEERLMAFLMAE